VNTIIIAPELAFGAMGNPQGFHGNGVAIPGNVALQFEIVVLLIDYEIENLFDKSVEEKHTIAQNYKESGNKYHTAAKFYQASKMYTKALDIIDDLLSMKLVSEQETSKLKALQLLCLSNIAMTKMKTNEFNEAIKHCTAARLGTG